MGKADATADVNLVSLADSPHHAAEVAKPIDRDHRRFVERRTEKSAGQVSAVMFNEVQPCPLMTDPGLAQRPSYTGNLNAGLRAVESACPPARARRRSQQFARDVRFGIARDGDMIRLAERVATQ